MQIHCSRKSLIIAPHSSYLKPQKPKERRVGSGIGESVVCPSSPRKIALNKEDTSEQARLLLGNSN